MKSRSKLSNSSEGASSGVAERVAAGTSLRSGAGWVGAYWPTGAPVGAEMPPFGSNGGKVAATLLRAQELIMWASMASIFFSVEARSSTLKPELF